MRLGTLQWINISFALIFLYNPIKGEETTGSQCNQLINREAFFSIKPLSSTKDQSLNINSQTLYFNFCYHTSKTCKDKKTYASLFQNDSTCINLSGESKLTDQNYSLLDSSDPSKGVSLVLSGGDKYNSELNYSVTFILYCNKSQDKSPNINQGKIEGNTVLISLDTSSGCPLLEISALWVYLDNNRYILGALMILVGAGECFFGLVFLGPTLFAIGFLTGFCLLIIVFSEFILYPGISILLIQIVIIVCVFGGAIIGQVAMSMQPVGLFAMGAWLGCIIAFFLHNSFLQMIRIGPPNLILYLTMLLCSGGAGVQACYVWERIVLISTSFIGAQFVKEITSVPWEYYVYMIIILALGGVGMWFQTKKKREREAITPEPEKPLVAVEMEANLEIKEKLVDKKEENLLESKPDLKEKLLDKKEIELIEPENKKEKKGSD